METIKSTRNLYRNPRYGPWYFKYCVWCVWRVEVTVWCVQRGGVEVTVWCVRRGGDRYVCVWCVRRGGVEVTVWYDIYQCGLGHLMTHFMTII